MSLFYRLSIPGIDSKESIPGLLKSLQIRARNLPVPSYWWQVC